MITRGDKIVLGNNTYKTFPLYPILYTISYVLSSCFFLHIIGLVCSRFLILTIFPNPQTTSILCFSLLNSNI